MTDLHPAEASHGDVAAAASRAEREELKGEARRGSLLIVLLILVVAISSASLVASVFSTSAAQDAKDASRSSERSSRAAERSADAAQDLAKAANAQIAAQRLENDDALCRAQFNAPIVDARTAVDDASSRLLIELTSQATLVLAGTELDASDLQAGVIAVNDLKDYSAVYAVVNAQYQNVIAVAASGNRKELDRLCAAGPTVFPPPA